MDQVFVIAEAGVNHNGSPDMALRLVESAARCGADCVKFQTFRAEEVVVGDAPKAAYQLETTDRAESQLDMLRKLQLPEQAWPEIKAACERNKVMFLSTPYTPKDVEFLDLLGVEAFKVASGQAAEPPFLRMVAACGKPVILSTGMCTLAEVDEAVRALHAGAPNGALPDGVPSKGSRGLPGLTLLQCTTDYPSPLEHANLRAMVTMGRALDLPVGYSDHTEDDTACIMAVAMGAGIIEKHFTLDRSLPGPDQSSSYDPDQFAGLIRALRRAQVALGSGLKVPSARESENMPNMRRGIVAARGLRAGQILEAGDMAFKRPVRAGLPAAMADLLVGRALRRDVAGDEFLDLGMFGERE